MCVQSCVCPLRNLCPSDYQSACVCACDFSIFLISPPQSVSYFVTTPWSQLVKSSTVIMTVFGRRVCPPRWRVRCFRWFLCLFALCRRLPEEAAGGHRVRWQRLHQKDERWLWASTFLFQRITVGSGQVKSSSSHLWGTAVDHWKCWQVVCCLVFTLFLGHGRISPNCHFSYGDAASMCKASQCGFELWQQVLSQIQLQPKVLYIISYFNGLNRWCVCAVVIANAGRCLRLHHKSNLSQARLSSFEHFDHS